MPPKVLLQKRDSNEKFNGGGGGGGGRNASNSHHSLDPGASKGGKTANSTSSSSTSLMTATAAAASSSTASLAGGGIEGALFKLFPRPPQVSYKSKSFFHLLEFNSKNKFEELDSFDPKVFPLQNPTTLAIGVIGRSGSGKTTLISSLMDLLQPLPEKSAGGGGLVLKKPIQGIDCYCADNILLLDTFPLFAYPERMAKRGFSQEYLSILVKKMLLFILSTCHVVLVVLDKAEDEQVFQLLASIQALKRKSTVSKGTSSSTSVEADKENKTDMEPHIIPLLNKCKPDHFSLSTVETAKEKIQSILQGSHLNFSYSIPPLKLAQTLLSDCPRTISPVNYYALPLRPSTSPHKTDESSHPVSSVADLVASWSLPATYPVALKQLVQSLKLIPNFTNKSRYCISYREWYQQASNSWNGIQRIQDEKF